MTGPSLEFLVADAADQGARSYQEDSIRVWPTSGTSVAGTTLLAVLSDGMGGHVSGEVASRIASTRYVEIVRAGSGDPIERLLERALILSNDAIGESVRKDSALKGMGCTLVAAYFSNEGLRWTSVGDSSLLLYRDSQLLRLNEDHSLGALLDKQAEANIISYEEARNDPRRRVLRSALVGSPLAVKEVRVAPLPLRHDDWVIVASDGLETLSGDEISNILHEYCNEIGHPKDVVEHLLQAVRAKRVPNQDNTSIVVTRVCDPTQVDTKIVAPKTVDARRIPARTSVDLTTDPFRPAQLLSKPRAIPSARAAALAQSPTPLPREGLGYERTERVPPRVQEPDRTEPATERLLEPATVVGPMRAEPEDRNERRDESGGTFGWIAAIVAFAIATAVVVYLTAPGSVPPSDVTSSKGTKPTDTARDAEPKTDTGSEAAKPDPQKAATSPPTGAPAPQTSQSTSRTADPVPPPPGGPAQNLKPDGPPQKQQGR